MIRKKMIYEEVLLPYIRSEYKVMVKAAAPTKNKIGKNNKVNVSWSQCVLSDQYTIHPFKCLYLSFYYDNN